jgi:adenylate cyclase
MSRVKHIEIDLNTYKMVLQFQNSKEPLILHFDTPSRKFYLSLIALIVHEMKRPRHSGHVYIRKYETLLKFMDDTLAGSYASGTIDGMWEKIRKAWHYSLPNLEEAAHFKIERRDHVSPYEKGGKYLYACTEDECDIWASLFGIDAITNKWRFRFAIDSAGLALSDVTLKFGDMQEDSAWDAFLKHLEKASTKILSGTDSESAKSAVRTSPIRWYLLAATVVILIILLVGGVGILNRYLRPVSPSVESVATAKPSIAILPFVNVSDDPDKDYFCDGITEELINSLARVKDLRVISRTSAFYFKNKGFDLHTIGEKLGVENILEGSVRVSGDKLRISAQLIKVADDSHLWAETYDREMKDIFTTQENLTQEIACSLKSRLGCEDDKLLIKRHTNISEAHNYYLKGRYHWVKKGHEKAIECFNNALALDPNYALPYTGLADVHNRLAYFFGKSPSEYYPKTKEFVMKALVLDDELSEAYASLGYLKLHYEWDWEGTEKALRRAVELNPGNALAHRYLSSYYKAIGNLDECLREVKIGLKIDPLDRGLNIRLAAVLRKQGKLDQSIEQYKKTLELYPKFSSAIMFLGYNYILKGKNQKGIEILKKAVQLTKGKSPYPLSYLGYAYGVIGEREKATKILNDVLERRRQGYFSPNFIAFIYSGLGDKDNAFKWLEKSYEEGDPRHYSIKTSRFHDLHNDPRWKPVLKKIGLE